MKPKKKTLSIALVHKKHSNETGQDRAWFSCLLRHPTRTMIGSWLSTLKPHGPRLRSLHGVLAHESRNLSVLVETTACQSRRIFRQTQRSLTFSTVMWVRQGPPQAFSGTTFGDWLISLPDSQPTIRHSQSRKKWTKT